MRLFIIAALSADGLLADQKTQKSTDWTSQADFDYFVSRTKQAGVCIMGSTTYQTIGHPLKDRLTIVYTTKPNTLPNTSNLESCKQHRATNTTYTTQLPPKKLVSLLTNAGYNEIAICGGTSIYTLFLQSGLVNTLYLTYEPILFGQGVPLFNAPISQKLKLTKTTPLSSQTTLMEYQVI